MPVDKISKLKNKTNVMRLKVDKTAKQRNGKLTKWQVGEVRIGWIGKLINWQVDEMTSLESCNMKKWLIDKVESWQRGKLMK